MEAGQILNTNLAIRRQTTPCLWRSIHRVLVAAQGQVRGWRLPSAMVLRQKPVPLPHLSIPARLLLQALQVQQAAAGQEGTAAQLERQQQVAQLQLALAELQEQLAAAVQMYHGPGSAELQEERSNSLAHKALQYTRASQVRCKLQGRPFAASCAVPLYAAAIQKCAAMP